MKRRNAGWRVVVAAFVLAAAVAPIHAGAQSSPTSAVAEATRLEDARRAAFVASDAKAIERLLAEDCTYVHSNGIAQSRADLIGMIVRGEIRYLSFDVDAVEYRAYESMVVGTGTQTIALTNSGKPFSSRSRFTVVYAPVDGVLKLVSYQSTPLPEIVMQEKKP